LHHKNLSAEEDALNQALHATGKFVKKLVTGLFRKTQELR
jgi:hypothetical protein